MTHLPPSGKRPTYANQQLVQRICERRAMPERQIRRRREMLLEPFERRLGHGRRESIGVGRVTQIANTVHL